MLNDVEARNASIGPGTDHASETPSLSATAAEVRGLKRRVQLGVCGLNLALIPLYAFVFQLATLHVVINLAIGLLIATASIEVS